MKNSMKNDGMPEIVFHITEEMPTGADQLDKLYEITRKTTGKFRHVTCTYKNGKLPEKVRKQLLEKMRKRRTSINISPIERTGNEWEAKTLKTLPIIETDELAFPAWEIERQGKTIDDALKKILISKETKTKRSEPTEKPMTENEQNKIEMNSDTETMINDLMKKITDDKITEYVNELEEKDKMQFVLGWKLRHRIGNDRRKTILSAINAASNVIRTEIADDGRID